MPIEIGKKWRRAQAGATVGAQVVFKDTADFAENLITPTHMGFIEFESGGF